MTFEWGTLLWLSSCTILVLLYIWPAPPATLRRALCEHSPGQGRVGKGPGFKRHVRQFSSLRDHRRHRRVGPAAGNVFSRPPRNGHPGA